MRHKWNGSKLLFEIEAVDVFWLSAALYRAQRAIEASIGFQHLELEGARVPEDWAARAALAERRAAGEADSYAATLRESIACEAEFLEHVRTLNDGLSEPAAEAWNGLSSARMTGATARENPSKTPFWAEPFKTLPSGLKPFSINGLRRVVRPKLEGFDDFSVFSPWKYLSREFIRKLFQPFQPFQVKGC